MSGRLKFEYVLGVIVFFCIFSLYHVEQWSEPRNPDGGDVVLQWARKGFNVLQNADKTAISSTSEAPYPTQETPDPTQESPDPTQPLPSSDDLTLNLITEKRKKWKESMKEIPSTGTCKHTIHRDYQKDPVIFAGQADMPDCDVPCRGGGGVPDIGDGFSCSHVKKYERTMENRGRYQGDNNYIAGNSHLDSDVPIQYFSWAEYTFMKPPVAKTSGAALAAFVSNCGPQYRLQVLQTIMDSGLSVHSMGSCLNNRPSVAKNDGGGRLESKIDAVATYKFTFAFENSDTDDYVTEKLWGPLAAGSVPVYKGAPNAKKFAPSNRSVIFADDFKSPKELAEYLKLLDSNDTLYNEYLAWKFDGPTKEWIALIDLSIVHSNCRYCIRSADIDRITVGEVVTGPFEEENKQEMAAYEGKTALMLKIRERGKFWLRRIHLQELTLKGLYDKILQKYNDTEKGEIIGVYQLWDRNRKFFKSDDEISALDYGHELEIIFENPGSLDRASYTTWWYNKYKGKTVDKPPTLVPPAPEIGR